MRELEHLCEAFDRGLDEADAVAAPADREEAQPPPARRRHHRVGLLVVGGDHGGTAGNDQIGEQPELGGEIIFQRRMIVEMVAAEIGEGAGRHPNAVEPALIEAVR